jgi:uncharacterized protein (UPF0332 family)
MEKKSEKQSIIKRWSQRARETLQDALLLIEQGGSAGSIVDRSYFAMFYAVLALLATIDQPVTEHSAALALFDEKFIKQNMVPKKMGKTLQEAFTLRSTQESEELPGLTNEQAIDLYNSAVEFINSLEEKLSK